MNKIFLGVIFAILMFVGGSFALMSGVPLGQTALSVTPRPPTLTPTLVPTQTPTPAPLVGDAARGREIATAGVNGAPPCASCHALSSSRQVFVIAPSLVGISGRAGERVEGLSPEEYIAQSILDPSALYVSGFRPIMYGQYADHFGEQEIADLVAFLMTL